MRPAPCARFGCRGFRHSPRSPRKASSSASPMRWTPVPPGDSCIDAGIHRAFGLSDCRLTPASPCGHLCKNASDLFAFVSDRPCGSSTTSTGRARVGENSLPLSPEPHAMRKRTDVAMIETLAWLRDLGLENGGTRCRSCARWRGRTSVRPSNPGGQKIFSRSCTKRRSKTKSYDFAEDYLHFTLPDNLQASLTVSDFLSI